MARTRTIVKKRAHAASTKANHASSHLTLTNGPELRATTLFKTIKRMARETTRSGSRRHVYVITCYFDPEALCTFASSIRTTIKTKGGILTGITIAMDVGEWLRCRLSKVGLKHEIANAAQVSSNLVEVIPVQFPGRLMHAKAYAAIQPGEDNVKKGFVVVTSGNATDPGLGLREKSNLELATVLTDPDSLIAFEEIINQLAGHEVSPADAVKQDEYLGALALFCRGSFYHKWQGSLSSDIRFKLTLTEKGKAERQRNQATFEGYEPDSDSMSRDPLLIQDIFNRIPKPFPDAFWRTYGIDTLLGYWLPEPVAKLADDVLDQRVDPYLDEIDKHTKPRRVRRRSRLLKRQVKEWSSNGWIKDDLSVIQSWVERVKKFGKNKDLLKSRLHPFEKLPEEILVGESRATVRRTFDLLREQLMSKPVLKGTKAVLKKFIVNSMTLEDLDKEFDRIAKAARQYLLEHAAGANE